MLLSAAVLCVVAVAHLANGYPSQVATKACVNMKPQGKGHENAAEQNSKVPYDFIIDQNADSVEVTIKQKPGGPQFQGFMVQARSGSSTTPLGTFKGKGEDARTVTCSNADDTGSHNSPKPKSSASLIWTPPANFKGKIDFYVTVAENKTTFWIRQKGGSVNIK